MDNKRDSQDTEESSLEAIYKKLGDTLQALPSDRQQKFIEDVLDAKKPDRRGNETASGNAGLVESTRDNDL